MMKKIPHTEEEMKAWKKLMGIDEKPVDKARKEAEETKAKTPKENK